MSHTLNVQHLSKQFNHDLILSDLTFQLEKGEILSIVGPSGSGKTTLLRILAGLETPSQGSIHMYGKEITFQKANRRDISLVFQQPLLFPHMTVEENIAYGAKLAGKKDKNKITQLLEATGLDRYRKYFPAEISGGQQQRVALARAMATEPEIILFDEPFSSLDPKLRHEIRYWVRDFLVDQSITGVFVTHDTEEAMIMGDRLALFHEGTFQQIDRAEAIHENPANSFVADFLGGHLVIDSRHYVPVKDCSLHPIKEEEMRSYDGILQHITFQNGQTVGHILLKDLGHKIVLPLREHVSAEKITLYIKESSIRKFGGAII
ncbi:ABC transporter ATP-binding protein [Halobacillus sp. K22]|uniref:ABC transporter ATP-binding protein n=1 Tax=Halobacillus sp. K22 TaxID=3457431 RepID=UPI003FCE7A5D